MLGIRIPESARLVRNIGHALQYLVDHLTYFYVFYSNDWCSPGDALRADPEATVRFGREANPVLEDGARFYREALDRLRALAQGGDSANIPGQDARHPAYAASPEASLFILSHSPAAVAMRATLTEAQHLLLGSAAGEKTWFVGGLPKGAGVGPGCDPALSPEVLARCGALVRQCRSFIEEIFWPDMLLVARIFRTWATIGRTGTFLSWGEFPGPPGEASLFPGGVFTMDDPIRVRPADPDAVSEASDPAWTARDGDRYRLRFGPGEAAYHWANDDFRWFSVPRQAGQVCEVGPVARIIGAYAGGNAMVRSLVDAALSWLALPLLALDSTLGRVLARGVEAVVCIRAVEAWLGNLEAVLAAGNAPLRTGWTMPAAGEGIGLAELARGALLHRIRWENGRIVSHASLVPSLWNFSPRGGDGSLGPLERAVRSLAVADPARPIELFRLIHAFDPCNACVLRIEDRDTGRVLQSAVK